MDLEEHVAVASSARRRAPPGTRGSSPRPGSSPRCWGCRRRARACRRRRRGPRIRRRCAPRASRPCCARRRPRARRTAGSDASTGRWPRAWPPACLGLQLSRQGADLRGVADPGLRARCASGSRVVHAIEARRGRLLGDGGGADGDEEDGRDRRRRRRAWGSSDGMPRTPRVRVREDPSGDGSRRCRSRLPVAGAARRMRAVTTATPPRCSRATPWRTTGSRR